MDGQGVCLGGEINSNAYHCPGVEQGVVLVVLGVLVEIDAGEGRGSCAGVQRSAVDELKRSVSFRLTLVGIWLAILHEC